MPRQSAINWDAVAPHPVALRILPRPVSHSDRFGVTLIHENKDGELFGCIDINGHDPKQFGVCLSAWIEEAKLKGLRVLTTPAARSRIKFAQDRLREERDDIDTLTYRLRAATRKK